MQQFFAKKWSILGRIMQRPVIKVRNLTKRFGEFTAVDSITFTVEKGEIFAFLGPNGAGKSTTIKMLTTLLRPSDGSVELAGHDVAREQDAARSAFGIVFQDPSLDDELTAYENMELHAVLYGVPRQTLRRRVEELLDLVDLGERQDSKVKTFSGGMKRRLEIARGLLHHPSVLFLDEPTLGLDTQTRTMLWDYVRRLNQEKDMSVFFTTHYIEEAEKVATRIAIIDHGQIITTGTAAELKKQTKTKTLEDAYLTITGRDIREETGGRGDTRRAHMRARRMR